MAIFIHGGDLEITFAFRQLRKIRLRFKIGFCGLPDQAKRLGRFSAVNPIGRYLCCAIPGISQGDPAFVKLECQHRPVIRESMPRRAVGPIAGVRLVECKIKENTAIRRHFRHRDIGISLRLGRRAPVDKSIPIRQSLHIAHELRKDGRNVRKTPDLRNGLLRFIDLIFQGIRRRGILLRTVIIENGDIAIRKLPDVMLVGKGLAIDELKYVGFAAQPPDNIAGLQVDLRDLVLIPAREQQIAIVRQGQ